MRQKTPKQRSGRQQGPTQRDVARRVGVSQVTVSHVLSGRGRVSVAMRSRILRAADELGYRLNTAARAVSTGRFGCIALLLGMRPQASHLPEELVWGIEDALGQQDLHLLVARVDDQRLRTPGYVPNALRLMHADGLIINYTHWHPPELSQEVEANRLPAVWLNTKRQHDCVYPDEFEAANLVTKRLLRLGHRRIAYCDVSQPPSHGPDDVHFSTIDRYAGYAHALALAGLPPRRFTGGSGDNRIAATVRWLSAAERPTAVIAFDPAGARLVQVAALACQLAIPRQLSLVVFDERPNHDLDLPLATMLTPDQEVGRVGVEMLLERIRRRHPPPQLRPRALALPLVEGCSMGPPPPMS
jgi:LacI family transcriptional regulator